MPKMEREREERKKKTITQMMCCNSWSQNFLTQMVWFLRFNSNCASTSSAFVYRCFTQYLNHSSILPSVLMTCLYFTVKLIAKPVHEYHFSIAFITVLNLMATEGFQMTAYGQNVLQAVVMRKIERSALIQRSHGGRRNQ